MQKNQNFSDRRSTINSYFGMLRNANAYKERVKAAKYLGKQKYWFDGKLTKLIKQGAV